MALCSKTLDLQGLQIENKEDLIDYFIYYYEYSLLVNELNYKRIKTLLLDLSKDFKSDDLNLLWNYLFLKYNFEILERYPNMYSYLNKTIEKLLNNIYHSDYDILSTQVSLLSDLFMDLEVELLKVRPYEQFHLGSNYGKFIAQYEKEFVEYFEENKDKFSISKLDKLRLIKDKDSKYIKFFNFIFELYATMMNEIVSITSSEDDIDIEDVINEEIDEFLEVVKKGKISSEMKEFFIVRTIEILDDWFQLEEFLETQE